MNRFIMYCSLLGGLSGCISFTSARTGQVLEKGQVGGYAGISFYNEVQKIEDDDGDDDDEGRIYRFGTEVGVQRGMGSGWEIGARGATWGFGMLEGRYQLVDEKTYDVAVGLGLGLVTYRYDNESSSSTTESSGSIRVTDVPFYLSTKVSRDLSLYFTPRYLYLHAESGSETDDDSKSSARTSSFTIGGLWGRDIAYFGEITYIKGVDKDDESVGSQVSGGVVFR